ncbi:PIG-L family deacetylase [Rhodopirellula sp. JC740]|uniref:PIG-L family deacetylase n=1 Tax=Rhodopirellula halodulae TaxID=2894198 RepID=A0ABS8NIK8_9BACT|nr:PIG-L family deacetylase [Rhodopirellula sp. JC740]MCC9643394.1 PIG-L family deacetylase [Rhodopirellula sp. JC740]
MNEPIPLPTDLLLPTETESALDVIAVGAHPDDVETACGGTLAKMVRQGYRVGIIDLTDGEPTPHCPDVATRLAESIRAAECLGVHARVQLNLPNRTLMDGFVARIALARQFRRFRPRIVMGFGQKTAMASPDHWQAMQITDAAVFYSRLCRWDEHFDGASVHAVARQLYFRLAFEPDVMPGESHHLIVDVGDCLEQKLASIAAYASQFDHKPKIADRIRAAALVTGSQAGCWAGESFASAHPYSVSDLVRTVMSV